MDKKKVPPTTRRLRPSTSAGRYRRASSSEGLSSQSKEGEKVEKTEEKPKVRRVSRKKDREQVAILVSELNEAEDRSNKETPVIVLGGGNSCNQCHNCEGDSPAGSGSVTKALRADRTMKLTPARAGTYEPDEDTMLQARDGDWSPQKNTSTRVYVPPRPSPTSSRKRFPKWTYRQIIGKAIEYGVVAGFVVAVFAVVSRKQAAAAVVKA